MDKCDWCNLSEEDKQFQVYESKCWSVFLSDEQDYIKVNAGLFSFRMNRTILGDVYWF